LQQMLIEQLLDNVDELLLHALCKSGNLVSIEFAVNTRQRVELNGVCQHSL